jgi:phosphinothricin acetyltransferase
MTRVRPCTAADLPQITAIYDHYIRDTAITFDIDPWTVEQREAWFAHYDVTGRHRALVVVGADDPEVLGYATSSQYRPKQAYETSVETSVYLRPDAGGSGLGTLLYAALFDAIAGEDVHRAYAGITEGNPASDAIHARFGFVPWGTSSETGRKLGRFWDVTWWEKRLA